MTPTEKRIAITEFCGLTICRDCLCAIDEECCHCGRLINGHGFYDNHSPVPMGCRCGYAVQPQPKWGGVPDYLNDLNTIHEVEKRLTSDQRHDYIRILCNLMGGWVGERAFTTTFATAAQRADALLITIGKLKLTQE